MLTLHTSISEPLKHQKKKEKEKKKKERKKE
jgi:hypothetical protein